MTTNRTHDTAATWSTEDDTVGFTPALVAGAAAAGIVIGASTVATGVIIGVAIGTAINNSTATPAGQGGASSSAPTQGGGGSKRK